MPLRLALYFFAAAIVFEYLNLGITSNWLSFSKIAGYCFFLVAMAYPKHSFTKPPGPFKWFAAYLLSTIVIGAFLSTSHALEMGMDIFSMVQMVVLFWVCSSLFSSDRALITETLWILASSCLVLSTLQITGIVSTAAQAGIEGRGTVLGMNANEYGLILVVGITCLTGFVATYRYLGVVARLVLATGCVPMAFEIVATGSRGAVVSLLIGLAVLPLSMSEGKWSRVRSVFVVIAALATVYFYAINSPFVVSRWDMSFEHGDVSGRERIYAAAIQMVSERPIFGWGPVTHTYELGARVHAYQGYPRDTHNLLLYVLTQVGLLGSIPFLIGTTECVVRAWRGRRYVNGPTQFALLCVILVMCLSNTLITFKLLWITLAFSSGISRDSRVVDELVHLRTETKFWRNKARRPILPV
jgi:O-antigen ligase